MKPTNLLVILSDEHNKRVLGCYGHPMIGDELPRRPGSARLGPEADVPWPEMYDAADRPRHPFIDAMRKCLRFDRPPA